MNQTAAPFIDEMATLSPALSNARDEAVRYWSPKDVPSAVLLLAFGHRLADDFDAAGIGTSEPVFDGIERALAEGDAATQAAASAMIEAVVARAVDLEIWPEMRTMFRDKSAAHALTCMTLDR